MLRACRWLLVLAWVAGVIEQVTAGTLQEDFSTDPMPNGWRICGNTNLFVWNAGQGNLAVTWDSSTSNSYFYHPLRTVLSRDDDFALEFDLRLLDITTTTKPGPFEIAVAFINYAEATRSNYWRGSGIDAVHGPTDVVEFDYFPAGYIAGWGGVAASVSPTIVSSNNLFASQFALLQLTNGQVYHVAMSYTASNATLRTTLTCNGAPFGDVGDLVLDTNFTDFRVDSLAICSYSDAGDDYDSVLAHGVVDNVLATIPPAPVGPMSTAVSNGVWEVSFASQTNWIYALERTTDLNSWSAVSDTINGNGTMLVLEDLTPPPGAAFYRVRAQKP